MRIDKSRREVSTSGVDEFRVSDFAKASSDRPGSEFLASRSIDLGDLTVFNRNISGTNGRTGPVEEADISKNLHTLKLGTRNSELGTRNPERRTLPIPALPPYNRFRPGF